MGLFGGMNEEELRTSGTPATARVTYVDDTGKRREGGRQARIKLRVKIDSGSARGRELDQTKWVAADRPPRVGDAVQIRFDPDHVDDWAWGDAAMYGLAAPAAPAAAAAVQALQGTGFDVSQLQQMIDTAFEQGNVTIEGSSQVIDARSNPELRSQIVDTLRGHGIDIEAMQAAGQVPGPPSAGDTATRLRHLDELQQQGLLTEAEHREQRQRIIDSI
jgi:hypothetical protein